MKPNADAAFVCGPAGRGDAYNSPSINSATM